MGTGNGGARGATGNCRFAAVEMEQAKGVGRCDKGADERGSSGVSDEAAKMGVNNEVIGTGADDEIVGMGADDEAGAAGPRADDERASV